MEGNGSLDFPRRIKGLTFSFTGQDEGLDLLAASIARQKSMASAINEEVDAHNGTRRPALIKYF